MIDKLFQFPQVRLSAHLARTSHELSVSLMKKFGVTGDQIVVSVIPHIIQAVDLGVSPMYCTLEGQKQ